MRTFRSLAVCCWLVTLAVTIAGCRADSATDPGGTTTSAEIASAYAKDGVGSTTLYLLGADGVMRALLPDLPAPAWAPEWSPDGRELVFSRDFGGRAEPAIWFVRPDGSGLRPLDGDTRSYGPRWSADGTRVFFIRLGGTSATSGIWSARPDGTDARLVPLPGDVMTYPAPPAPSPDGRSIAFIRPAGEFMSTIWVADLDGSNLRRLASGNHDGSPRWAPDGSRVVFVRALEAEQYRQVVFLVNADGGGERQLTGMTRDESYYSNPVWSPDGQWILYERWLPVAGQGLRCTIHKIPVAGGAAIDLLGERATGTCAGLAWRSVPTATR